MYNKIGAKKLESPEKMNERELMEYFGYRGWIGKIELKFRMFRSWILQFLASISPSSNLSAVFQRARGVNVGKHVFLGPNVVIDLVHPELVTIEDYVSIGMNSMIFAHSNPTCSIEIKKHYYPRKVAPVRIKKGAWIPPGTIILCGVTIGENSIVGAGSVVTRDIEPYTVAVGAPAKEIEKLKTPPSKEVKR